MTHDKDLIGQCGETIGRAFLEKSGYRVLHQNWTCPLGELDLVAEEGESLVFVEVKSRTSSDFGIPEEAVTRAKQHRLIRLAQAYAKRYGIKDKPFRFDVLAVTPDDVRLIKDAFWAEQSPYAL